MFKKPFLLIIAGLIALFITGCGDAEISTVDNNESEAKAEKAQETNDEEAEAEEEEIPEFYSPDETISVDGVEISINSLSWGKEAEYIESENGNIIRIEVTIKNNSEDNAFVDSSEFDLTDEEGNMVDTYFGNDNTNMFGSEIKKGKQLKGVLEYDVPESESYELYYEPSFSFKENTEVKWLINQGDIE